VTYDGWQSPQFLEMVARTEGLALEDARRTRWHRLGLLPKPAVESLGRSGKRTWYPPGTADQLRVVIRYHKRYKKLSDVAWKLWWDRYGVEIGLVRSLLAKTADGLDESVGAIRKLSGIERRALAGSRAITSGGLGGVRRRVGTSTFPAFLDLVAKIATGTESYSSEEVALLDRAAGLDRAFSDKVLDIGPLAEPDTNAAGMLAKAFSSRFSQTVQRATDEELLRARDDLRLFLEAFGSFGSVTSEAFGPGAYGLTAFARFVAKLSPRAQQGLLLLWIELRRLPETEGAEEVLAAGRTWLDEGAPRYEAIRTLALEVPALRPLFTPKRLSAAFRTQAASERFMREVERVAGQHRGEVDAVLARHPEIAQLAP